MFFPTHTRLIPDQNCFHNLDTDTITNHDHYIFLIDTIYYHLSIHLIVSPDKEDDVLGVLGELGVLASLVSLIHVYLSSFKFNQRNKLYLNVLVIPPLTPCVVIEPTMSILQRSIVYEFVIWLQ